MAHSNRPTLPPLHSLGLPRGDIPPRIHKPNGPTRPPVFPLIQPYLQQRHQPPNPPSTASETPTPSVPCLRPGTNVPPPRSLLTSTAASPCRKVRLRPSSFEDAEAVVLVPPPTPPGAPPGQVLLIVDPALAQLRRGQRRIEPGTRVLPYRMVRGPRPQTEPSDTKA